MDQQLQGDDGKNKSFSQYLQQSDNLHFPSVSRKATLSGPCILSSILAGLATVVKDPDYESIERNDTRLSSSFQARFKLVSEGKQGMATRESGQQAIFVFPLYRPRDHIGSCLQRNIALMQCTKFSYARSLSVPGELRNRL